MLFNSYIFIFLFLPIALAGYYGFSYLKLYRVSNIFLIGMSLWFYGYFNKKYLLIICGSIMVNFLISKMMVRWEQKRNIKKLLLVLGIGINVAVILYFKYYDFFIKKQKIRQNALLARFAGSRRLCFCFYFFLFFFLAGQCHYNCLDNGDHCHQNRIAVHKRGRK